MIMSLPLAAQRITDVTDSDAAELNQRAFERTYARVAPPLWAYLLRLTGDPTLTDDLLQDTFVRLLDGRVPPMDAAGEKRYLFRVATNLLTDHRRRWWRWSGALPDVSVGDVGAEIDRRTDIRRVIATMRPRERQLLWLAYVEGFSHAEIAEIAGLRVASVRPLLFRARRRMAKSLRAAGLDEGRP